MRLLIAWLGQLGEEHDNLRAALSYSLESENPGFVLRLAAALSWFWDARGHFGEGVSWHELALAKSGLAEPAERAGALYGLGRLLESRSDFEEAQGYLDEARVLYEALGNWKRVAESQMVLGWVAMYQGEAARARAYLEESLAAGRELASQGAMANNNNAVSGSLNGLGVVARESGDFERAQALWEDALAVNRERGDVWGVSGIIFNMGYTELARGNHKQATRLLEESLTLSREQKLRSHEALALGGLGLTTTLRGDPEQGEALLKESLTIYLELRDKMGVVEDLEGAAEAARALGQHLRAARLWGTASVMRAAHPWSNTERMLHGPLLVSARSSLDEAAWEEAFAEGRAMTLEEAVEYALSEDGDADTPEPRISESRSAGEPPAFLTRREREVASLVAQGLTNRQIAQELVLSRHTVDKHIKNILKKLSLHSREQVASHLRGQ